jgi:glycosyltransferase involved in cell wall biosynthesis
MRGRAAAVAARTLKSRQVATVLRAAARLRPDRPGTTVVTVTWESAGYLAVALHALQRFTPEVRVLVVDNASTDATAALVAATPGIRVVRLPVNIGHGAAMDIGFLLARTELLVALDVDAFPLSAGWLDELTAPLRSGATVSGVHMGGGYAHPACLAIRRQRFLRSSHTFTGNFAFLRGAGTRGLDAWDVGERISMREGPERTHLIEPTEVRGPGAVGMTFGAVAYHNAYATRHRAEPDSEAGLDGARVTADDATEAWAEATLHHLGLTDADRERLVPALGPRFVRAARRRRG